MTTALEPVIKPYLELRREIIQKFSKKDEKTGQFTINPENQDEAMKEMETLAQAEVELDLQLPLVLSVKDDSFLDFNTVNSFDAVLGSDNFRVVTIETPRA